MNTVPSAHNPLFILCTGFPGGSFCIFWFDHQQAKIKRTVLLEIFYVSTPHHPGFEKRFRKRACYSEALFHGTSGLDSLWHISEKSLLCPYAELMTTSQQSYGAPTHEACHPIEDEPENSRLPSHTFYGCVFLILRRGEYEDPPPL
jgi:hypothetical protein